MLQLVWKKNLPIYLNYKVRLHKNIITFNFIHETAVFVIYTFTQNHHFLGIHTQFMRGGPYTNK